MSKKTDTSDTPKQNNQNRNKETKEKIDKHLSDIDDVITEKDIENINSGDPRSYDLSKEDDEKLNKDVKEITKEVKKRNKGNRTDDNNSPSIDTSWNVIE